MQVHSNIMYSVYASLKTQNIKFVIIKMQRVHGCFTRERDIFIAPVVHFMLKMKQVIGKVCLS